MLDVVLNLFRRLVAEVSQGFLLFGGPLDIVAMLLDVFVTTCLFYFILKLLSETRAWQLLKGVVFLILVGQLFSFMGLQAISFLLNSALSFLALALLVLFQPELRKALETVGRNTLNFMQSSPFEGKPAEVVELIEAIKVACRDMSAEYTGALILIERQTKLGEIIEKGQAVVLNASITSTMLEQIFYKGSPLHDGACVIRGNKIYAARCHVPLSGSTRLNKDYGTRHRAAISASEISDAIAIVCSEEQGSISVAVDGNLIKVKDADVLAEVLEKFLISKTKEELTKKRSLWQNLNFFFNRQFELNADILDDLAKNAGLNAENEKQEEADVIVENSANLPTPTSTVKRGKAKRRYSRSRIVLQLTALILALFVWLYVQATTNVVSSRRYNVKITAVNHQELDKYNVDYRLSSWNTDVLLQARERNLRNINAADIQATIDFKSLEESMKEQIRQAVSEKKTSLKVNLPIKVSVPAKPYYSYRILNNNPATIEVVFLPILQKNADGTKEAAPVPTKVKKAAENWDKLLKPTVSAPNGKAAKVTKMTK